jgi:dihydroorotase
MLDMHANGAIAFSDGWKPIQNVSLMLKALEYVKSFEGTLIQIPMDANLSLGGLMHEGAESTQLGMPGIPAIAETLQVYRDIELLRYTNSRLHITGIAAAESVELIRRAKADGLKITCSVTPYHLSLNDEVLRSYDSVYKVMPPIRSEKDRQALIEGLKDGTIDCIASHHRPQEWDAKAKEFEYASDGMNVQELSFAIAHNATNETLTIEHIIKSLANNANTIFGLNKDAVQEGACADFTLFTVMESTQLNEMKSRVRNNPFLGKSLLGKVLGIVKCDTLVMNN